MGIKTIPALKAETRSSTGKAATTGMRGAGAVPANLYGQGQGNLELSLDEHQLMLGLRAAPALLALETDSGALTALIKEVQFDTYGQKVLHMDLMRVELGDTVEVPVPLEFFGLPAGAADGGRLEILKRNVQLAVRADSIPDLIRTNAGMLALDETITFGDLELPEGAVLLSNPEGIACICRINKRAAAAAKRAEVKRGKA